MYTMFPFQATIQNCHNIQLTVPECHNLVTTTLPCSKYVDNKALDVNQSDPSIPTLHKSPERTPKIQERFEKWALKYCCSM